MTCDGRDCTENGNYVKIIPDDENLDSFFIAIETDKYDNIGLHEVNVIAIETL